MNAPRRLRVVLPVVAVVALAACGGGGSEDEASPSPAASVVERPSTTAELEIVAPRNGVVVDGTVVDLRVALRGGRIAPQTSTDLVPDAGHLHVLLDDELISMTEGLRQSIPGVGAGPHRLTVEFVATDHAPFDPRVVEVVAFEVAP